MKTETKIIIAVAIVLVVVLSSAITSIEEDDDIYNIYQNDIGEDCTDQFVKGVDDDGTLDCATPSGSGGATVDPEDVNKTMLDNGTIIRKWNTTWRDEGVAGGATVDPEDVNKTMLDNGTIIRNHNTTWIDNFVKSMAWFSTFWNWNNNASKVLDNGTIIRTDNTTWRDEGASTIHPEDVNKTILDNGTIIRTNNLSNLELSGDIDFNQFKAIAMICDNGATVPASAIAGQWFLHTPTGRKVLMMYDGTNWIPIISIGSMTMYVDTAGSDDIDKGGASGASAFLTVQYAIDAIAGAVGGNVTINIGTGTFAGAIKIQGKTFTGTYGIYIYGAGFDDTSLTIDAATQGTTGTINYGTITDNGEGWGLRSTLESGNTDSIGAGTFELKDTGQNFITTCRVGMNVHNTDDNTWAKVTVVVSDTELTLDTDIMDDGENYIIGWPEHKGTWITFDDATDTVALQGDIELILDNDDDTLTIVGNFDATPAGADTAYISTLQTIITGKITIVTGQLGIYFYRIDLDAPSSQIDAQLLSQSYFFYSDIKSATINGGVDLTRCFIHKEDDVKTSNRLLFASSQFTYLQLTSSLVDAEGRHYSTSSTVRGIDVNNNAVAHLRTPPSVIQNFHAKAGVTNLVGIYMRVNGYVTMWTGGGECRNWIRFCDTGIDASLGAVGQYCIGYTVYENNAADRTVDATTFAVVS